MKNILINTTSFDKKNISEFKNQKKINLIFKRLIEIELKCKSGIYPDKILISQFILSTSLMAKNSART